ncbi:MAG: hypothetical protein Q7T01_02510 [bacterium]|nr:hypothetical protein [bacterium]
MQSESIRKLGANAPIISARTLVMRLTARAQELGYMKDPHLFGAVAVTNPRSFQGGFAVPYGDFIAFLQERAERFGSTIQVRREQSMEDAIIAVAEQVVVELAPDDPERSSNQIKRMALEYVIQTCLLRPVEVEPFVQYAEQAGKLRKYLQAVNAVRALSTEDGFASTTDTDAERILRLATQAWSGIRTTFATSAHLGTLRERIVTAPMYTSAAVWREVQQLEPTTRRNIVSQLLAMTAEQGTQFVSRAMVADAAARITGNEMFGGVASGVSLQDFISGAGQDRWIGATPADNDEGTSFQDSSAASVGELLSGLFGTARGTFKQVGDGIEVHATICDTIPTEHIGVPIFVLAGRQGGDHQRYRA